MKYIFVTVIALIMVLASTVSPVVNAHRDGCHRWHSCPSDNGSYICGDLGYFDQCGSSSTPSQAAPATKPAATAAPKVTSKVVTNEEVVQFKTVIKNDYREYPGYEKILSEGLAGKRTIISNIAYTNGVETQRSVMSDVISTKAKDRVVVVGKRQQVASKITNVKSMKSGWFGTSKKYSLTGTTSQHTDLLLKSGDKIISRARSDSTGKYTFTKVNLSNVTTWVQVVKESSGAHKAVTEKTLVNTNQNSAMQEYDVIHGIYVVVKVVDGDTIKVQTPDKIETVRMIGIDTPESVDPRKPVQCFGKEAFEHLKTIALHRQVRLESDPTQSTRDKYKRLLSYVYLGDQMLNRKMILDGYAYEYTHGGNPYANQTDFKATQKDAETNYRGLWNQGTCSGKR